MDYKVTGMTCASCSARVEKTVLGLQGVDSCTVNLLTGDMRVEGSVDSVVVMSAVKGIGYGISEKGEKAQKVEKKESEVKSLLIRFVVSLIFLLPLSYIAMGHVMWGAPIFSFFANNPLSIAIIELVLTSIIMVINQKIYIKGIKGLVKRAPNMDTLVSIGSIAGFTFSLVKLFEMTTLDISMQGGVLHEIYFEASGMILVLITLGKMLEAISKGRTTTAIEALVKLSPDTAVIIREGKEVIVKLDDVVVGDLFVVKVGDKVAVDGVVVSGDGSIDESALTGESIPVDKVENSEVYQGTILKSGYVVCRAVKVGEDTTLSQIIKTVTDASSSKAPISRLADKVSGVFVPVVGSIAFVTLIVWLIVGQSVGFSLARAISVLVISCPCALALATPVAIMVTSGKGAKNGILFKTAESIETLGKVKVVALDKTGTLTMGVPKVTDVISEDEVELFKVAYSLELKSEHPLSRAIVEEGERRGVGVLATDNFEIVAGRGLCCSIDKVSARGGNLDFVREICDVPNEILEKAQKLAEQGKTPLYFAKGKKFLGIIAVSDTLKDDAKKSIESIKALGVKVVMITGDNEATARAIASEVGIDEVYAGVLPDDKASIIKGLTRHGKVAMVGDGINDAPALTVSDVGVAIGAGSDIAIDSASVVIMGDGLDSVVKAVRLTKRTLRIIKGNLFWAFCYNTLGIPLAAGVFVPILGWSMNPMFGALAMSLSSVCVISNTLRINAFNLGDKNKKRKVKNMKKVMKIEGIMCGHCEARVKKALETLDSVTLAEVSHVTGEAVVTLNADTPNDLLKATVEAQDYKVIDIK